MTACRPMTDEEYQQYLKDKPRLEAEAQERDRKFKEEFDNSEYGKECNRKNSRSIREIYTEDYINKNKPVAKFTEDKWNSFVVKNSKHSYNSVVVTAAIHLVQFENESAFQLLCDEFPGLSGFQAQQAQNTAMHLLDTGIIDVFYNEEDQ